MKSPAQLKFGGQHNAPRNNNKSNSNRPNNQRTMLYGHAPAFYKFAHLVNPASSDGRTIVNILEEEILFLNRLWSFCEDEFTLIVSFCISVQQRRFFTWSSSLKSQNKKTRFEYCTKTIFCSLTNRWKEQSNDLAKIQWRWAKLKCNRLSARFTDKLKNERTLMRKFLREDFHDNHSCLCFPKSEKTFVWQKAFLKMKQTSCFKNSGDFFLCTKRITTTWLV